MKITKLLLIIFIGQYIFSCRGTSEPILFHAPNFETPYIPGIYRHIYFNGQPTRYPIGNPDMPDDPTSTIVVRPIGNLAFKVEISKPLNVDVWIVKGIGWNEKTNFDGTIKVGTQNLKVPGGMAYSYSNFTFERAGIYHIQPEWDITPIDGFYRAYFKTDEVEIWYDFVIIFDISCSNFRRLGLEEWFSDCN